MSEPGLSPASAEVVDRLVALKACVVYALGAPPREVVAAMRARAKADERAQMDEKADEARDAIWTPIYDTPEFDALTPRERALSEATLVTLTEEQQIEASWAVEGMVVLAWALGFVDELPPWDTQTEPDFLEAVPNPAVLARVRGSAALRPREDLERMAGAAELWHWRSRTRELIESGMQLPDELKRPGVSSLDDVVRLTAAHALADGTLDALVDGDFPARGGAYRALDDDAWFEVRSIAHERHRAFNWLLGRGDGWDETPTDT
jgi:hypothetical protein